MSYSIEVSRSENQGTMTFQSGNVQVSTTCWWDPAVKVDAGTYTGYATLMTSKKDSVTKGKRPGIWLGAKVPVNGGTRKLGGIFIHEGTGAGWSDGCIVAIRSEVLKIHGAINPKDKGNVMVTVKDKAKAEIPDPAPGLLLPKFWDIAHLLGVGHSVLTK